MKITRVLIVDDSPSLRALIRGVLQAESGIEVVGEANNALEARQAIKQLAPDVITLDVEMPQMNGLELLDKIMRLRPTPVIMVSSLTSRGADAAIKALELGAFHCVGKPTREHPHEFAVLADLVRAAAQAPAAVRPVRVLAPRQTPTRELGAYRSNGNVVAIGSSTGGVEALIEILSIFPANCPATVIAQHMPASFTRSLAERLDTLCAPEVMEAFDGAWLEEGKVYIAPGGDAHLEVEGSGSLRCRLRSGPLVHGHRPSADVLFATLTRAAGAAAVGVILTGMGRDGAEGLLAMRRAGAPTLGQDPTSAIVYGMPRAAFEIGAVAKQLRLEQIGPAILDLTSAAETQDANVPGQAALRSRGR